MVDDETNTDGCAELPESVEVVGDTAACVVVEKPNFGALDCLILPLPSITRGRVPLLIVVVSSTGTVVWLELLGTEVSCLVLNDDCLDVG